MWAVNSLLMSFCNISVMRSNLAVRSLTIVAQSLSGFDSEAMAVSFLSTVGEAEMTYDLLLKCIFFFSVKVERRVIIEPVSKIFFIISL